MSEAEPGGAPSGSVAEPSPARLKDLRANLDRLQERISNACARVGRDPHEVTVIAVTKTYPAVDVLAMARLGLRDVGENRSQELTEKRLALSGGPDLIWHFIGQVQTNKAAAVVASASMVHAVDRPGLVVALAKAAATQGRELECLIQVSLDSGPGRGGAPPGEVLALAAQIASCTHLRLRGIMAVAPLEGDARVAFARLPGLSDRVTQEHPGADVISAGMSGDLEAALAERTTHLRVGTALLGVRV